MMDQPSEIWIFFLLLSKVINIFAIPAMSSEVEKGFLEARLIIIGERLSFHVVTIKALECLKSWFQWGIFTQDDLSKA